jgi:hypothetical protein
MSRKVYLIFIREEHEIIRRKEKGGAQVHRLENHWKPPRFHRQ